MAETIGQVRSRLAELKSQGKSESTSKEYGKLSQRVKEMKAGGTDSSGDFGGDFESAIKRATELSRQAVQPAVEQLQGQVSPLQERYSKIIEDIKGTGEVASNKQTLATSRELGRRGVLTTSGLGEQELATALQPVTQATQSQLGQAGLAQESALGNISSQIANILAGAGTGGISTAMDILRQKESQRQFDAQQQMAQEQDAYQRQMADRAYQQSLIPEPLSPVQSLINSIIGRQAQSATDTGVEYPEGFIGPKLPSSLTSTGNGGNISEFVDLENLAATFK